MTRNPTTRDAATAPATARVPFGTRAVRRITGADPVDLVAADRCTDPVVAALAAHVLTVSVRVDDLDGQLARDAARIADDLAALGGAEDAHLTFAWAQLADRAQRLATDRLSFAAWTEALNAAAHTYTRATAQPAAPDAGTSTPHPGV